MSEKVKLGRLITTPQGRDAVHIAIAPVTAYCDLEPGEDIGFVENGNTELVGVVHSQKTIGIVDPFIMGTVRKGERFFMFLYPDTITSLRHEWMHPAFKEAEKLPPSETSVSEQWLREFAEEVGVSYKVLMDAAEAKLEDETAYHTLPYDTPSCVYHNRDEFWKHYETVTGVKAKDPEAIFFTCSC